jgi:hypothetical protein
MTSTAAQAEIFKGVDFPSGISSFADAVVNYSPGLAFGGPSIGNRDPSKALGAPDVVGVGLPCGNPATCHAVSLGHGGSITLRFTDNYLTGSNSSAIDLWVFESYGDAEIGSVEISADGSHWFSVGKVPGSTAGVDIDAFGFGSSSRFSYVRVTDDPLDGGQSGPSAGFDVDAIGAASSVVVPEPQTYALLGAGLLMLAGIVRRRVM